MQTEGSLPHSQVPATCPLSELYQRISPGPRPFWIIRNTIRFHCEELLTPRPIPKLEDQPVIWRSKNEAIQGVTGGKDQTSGGCSLC